MPLEILTIPLAWLTMLVTATLTERLTVPQSPWFASSPRAYLFRLVAFTIVFLFFFSWSLRPAFGIVATTIFTGVFVAISRGKTAFVREPLVFADLAFILDIFRHPKLFYTGWLGPLFLLAAIGAIVGAIAGWFWLEPPLSDAVYPERLGLAAGCTVILLLSIPFVPGLRRLPERLALSTKPYPEAHRDISRDGLLATLLIDWLAWRGDDRSQRLCATPALLDNQLAHGEAADLIVVVQSESFLDFRRLHPEAPPLPNLDRARERAFAWGPLFDAFPGGYTMRTEFAFLTGLPPEVMAFDRYYPYLHAPPYGPAALPTSLARSGYRTMFIHPYFSQFFNRETAHQHLGFQHRLFVDDFAGADHVGDYVSDAALADRILAEAFARDTRSYIHAVTIENHGPWDVARFPDARDPIDVFCRHLLNADAMLGKLMDAFEAHPGHVVLAFFGDHVPLLKAFADPFPDSRTDYVIMRLGQKAPAVPAPEPVERRSYEIVRIVLEAAGLSPSTEKALLEREHDLWRALTATAGPSSTNPRGCDPHRSY